MDTVVALLAAALALMGSPGPATLGCAAAGAAYRSRALWYVAGISCGTSTVVLMVATGVTGLVTAIPGVAPIITVLAGAYILYLAWKIANAPPVGALDTSDHEPSMLAGYLFAVVNPKAYGAMGALFSGFDLMPGDPVAGNAIKAALLIPIAFIVNTIWMATGTALARLMRDPAKSRRLNIAFAVLLVGSVIVAVLL